jgi:hypothetical protein
MSKKKINKNIVMDMSATVFITGMIAYTIFGKPENNYSIDINNKDGFDVTGFLHSTAKSIDDFFKETFSGEEKTDLREFTGARIKNPIMNVKDYSIDEMVDLIGEGLYKRVTNSKTIKKRFHNMFPIIHAQYQGLKPTGPVTLELVTALPRGESAYDHLIPSPRGARGLFQTIQSTFDMYFPQYKNKPFSERKKLAYIPQYNAFAGISYLMDLDKFHIKNDPYYKRASKKEKQRRLIISYNAGPGTFQRAGFIIANLPNRPYPYKRDAINLSNYVLGLMYGNSYAKDDTKNIKENNLFASKKSLE